MWLLLVSLAAARPSFELGAGVAAGLRDRDRLDVGFGGRAALRVHPRYRFELAAGIVRSRFGAGTFGSTRAHVGVRRTQGDLLFVPTPLVGWLGWDHQTHRGVPVNLDVGGGGGVVQLRDEVPGLSPVTYARPAVTWVVGPRFGLGPAWLAIRGHGSHWIGPMLDHDGRGPRHDGLTHRIDWSVELSFPLGGAPPPPAPPVTGLE